MGAAKSLGELIMPNSSASAVFLPFGSLMGIIPVDAVPRQRVRVLGDFSNVIGCDRRAPAFHAIPVSAGHDPACTASPPSLVPSGDGGI